MVITSYSDIYKMDSSLRPYQQKAKKEIFESWDEVDNVLFQMPTGTGKTRLFTSLISDINNYSIQRREAVKILIVAHRTELIDQIDKHLDKYKVPHNIIAGGREKNYKFPVTIASIQTITNAHNIKDAKKLNVQFIIIDEAHHALAASYKKLWDIYPNAKRLGVTATPWRMNHQSFLELFNKLVMSMPIKDFIKQGYLSPYKYFSLRDDSEIRKTIDGIELDSFGEYKESSMEEKMDIGSIRAQLLNSYLSLAEGKKGIIYAINIVHAKHICEEYEKAGYKVVSIDSKTPSAERDKLVKDFRKGLIDIIVNVDIFSEGFDCPDIEFIQLARPTRSLVKYLQQVGRGLRPTENKQNCVILDNVGMYSRFGLPDARRHWNYHFKGKEIDEEPAKAISNRNGKSRYVDLSEGTEDMELIQDVNEIVENNPSAISDFFPIFGVTLGKTTWKQVEDMGYEIKVWEGGPGRYTDIGDFTFWDHDGVGIFSGLYRYNDGGDFPSLWKSKGFSWGQSYDELLKVFQNMGYKITVWDDPTGDPLDIGFKALSPDGSLFFKLCFINKHNSNHSSLSLNGLDEVSVDYEEIIIKKEQDEEAKEELSVEDVNDDNQGNTTCESFFSAVNDFFPIFGVILGKTTWEQAKELGGKEDIDEDTGEIYFDIENVHFIDFYNNIKTLTDIYWEEGYRDFPDSWNSKGFYWENSYDAWLEVFKRLGYKIEIENEPEQKMHDGRLTLSGSFEALSPDGTLSFNMDFRFGKKGHFTSSPSTLHSISVHYHESPIENKDDDYEDEEYVDIEEINPLMGGDVEKLKHAFNKKSTSYKYFWFMALLEIYKETQVEKITFRQILIMMVAKAWKYVFLLNGQFSQSDQLPKYLVSLKSITNLHSNSLESEVKDELNKEYDTLNINTILSPLLKNVPYRFLSPWIPFTDNVDVMKKTWSKDSRSPYELHNDHVVISDLWRGFLIEYYNSIQLLSEYGLESYLAIDQEYKEARDFYNTRFTSLNQLLKGIKRRKGQEVVKQFLEKYNFPLSGDITPAELMMVMPKSSCVIDRDGRKRVNVPGEMWSLKLLDKLLSEENLVDRYNNIHILEEYGIKSYLKTQKDIKDQNIIDTNFLSLSKLLQAINKNKDEKVVKQFLEKYNLSSKGEIKPSELMNIIPDSICTIDRDGRKRINLPGDMWSLKILDKLLSGKI